MSVLYFIRGEDGRQQPVYSLDDETLSRGLTRTYYDICMESVADGQSCDYIRYSQPGGPYVDGNGVINYASYLKDAYGITNAKNYERWGSALYPVGNFYVNKLFDDTGKLVLQEILPAGDSKFLKFVKIGLTMVAMVILAPLAAELGASLIGPELAAAYPQLAAAVGNTFLQTAANGGDVGKAVESVATSFVGGQFGSFVEGVSDSAVIGKIAAGASTSLINGGNLLPAVAGPIVSSVANDVISSLSSSVSTAPGGNMDDYSFYGDNDNSSWSFNDPVLGLDDSFVGDSGGQIYTFGGFDDTPDVTTNFHDPVYDGSGGNVDFGSGGNDWGSSDTPVFTPPDDINMPDPSIFLPDFQVQGGANVPTTQGGTDWGAALAKLGTIALQVYNQQHNPNIKSVTSSVRLPDGSVQTVQRNGTVTTTSPTGQSSTTQLPPGQPYRFPDGTVVMNNGNGTYTRQTASGQVSTAQYSASNALFSGGVSAPVLLAGAALLLFALRK